MGGSWVLGVVVGMYESTKSLAISLIPTSLSSLSPPAASPDSADNEEQGGRMVEGGVGKAADGKDGNGGKGGIGDDGGKGDDWEIVEARRYRQASEWPCVRFN